MRSVHGRRRVLVPALLVALAGIAFPDRAYAPFRGTLLPGSPFTIDVSSDVNNTDSCAATVLMINRQGRITNVTPLTVPVNSTGTIIDTAASSVDRVILVLNPPLPGPLGPPIVTVKVSQNNSTLINEQYNADTEIVFDAVP